MYLSVTLGQSSYHEGLRLVYLLIFPFWSFKPKKAVSETQGSRAAFIEAFRRSRSRRPVTTEQGVCLTAAGAWRQVHAL